MTYMNTSHTDTPIDKKGEGATRESERVAGS